jgi:hypothetical protein
MGEAIRSRKEGSKEVGWLSFRSQVWGISRRSLRTNPILLTIRRPTNRDSSTLLQTLSTGHRPP